ELLGAVVERLLKALREARPANPRQFFALACQHMRWELNDMARRLDEQPAAEELGDQSVPAPASSDTGLTPDGRRILAAIDGLPEDEREAFDLVRIQGMTQAEAARVLEVSVMTVNRRLNRGLQLLAAALGDLYPGDEETATAGSRPRPGEDPRRDRRAARAATARRTPRLARHAGRGLRVVPRVAAGGPQPLAAGAPPPRRPRRAFPVPGHPAPAAPRGGGAAAHPGLRGG